MLAPEGLNLARYHFHFRVTEPLRLSEYAGSALRGVFGRALMQLSGLQMGDVKDKTPLFLHSPYAEVFEPQSSPDASGILARLPDMPPLYVVEAPINGQRFLEEGDDFSFSVVLIGQALAHLPLIILAWRRALLMGLGKERGGKAELMLVEHELPGGELVSIYSEEKPLVQSHGTNLELPNFAAAADVHLHLLTPLRLQQQGRVLGAKEITPALFLRQLVRRTSIYWQMQQSDAINPEVIARLNQLADSVNADEKRLSFQQWARYSARQRQLMQMDGVRGHWLLRKVPPEMQQLLWLGQYLHVGKGTVYGLGGYVISQQEWRPSSKRKLENAI